jgi:hypothetical protein
VADGNRNLSEGRLLAGPERSVGEVTTHWHDEYALFDIIMSVVHFVGGWPGIALTFAFIQWLPVAWALRRALCLSGVGGIWVGLIGGFYFLLPRIQERPEALAHGFLLLLVVALLVEKPGTRWGYWKSGGLFVLWANVHSSFILGLAAVSVQAVHEAIYYPRERRFLLSRFGVVLASTLLTPLGWIRWLLPFQHAGDFWSTAVSPEMYPLSHADLGELLGMGAIAFLILGLNRKVQWWWWILLAASMELAVGALRFQGYFAMMLFSSLALPEKAEGLQKSMLSRGARITSGVGWGLLGIILVNSSLHLWRQRRDSGRVWLQRDWVASGSLEWLEKVTQKQSVILADWRICSYAHGPDFRKLWVLNDSGQARWSDDTRRMYYDAISYREGLECLLDSERIDAVVIGETNAHWFPVLQKRTDWKLAMTGREGAVFLRRESDIRSQRDDAIWLEKLGELESHGQYLKAFYLGAGFLSNDQRLKLAELAMTQWRWSEPFPTVPYDLEGYWFEPAGEVGLNRRAQIEWLNNHDSEFSREGAWVQDLLCESKPELASHWPQPRSAHVRWRADFVAVTVKWDNLPPNVPRPEWVSGIDPRLRWSDVNAQWMKAAVVRLRQKKDPL